MKMTPERLLWLLMKPIKKKRKVDEAYCMSKEEKMAWKKFELKLERWYLNQLI